MDYQALNFWWHAVETVMLVVLGVRQFFGDRQRLTAKALTQLRKHIDEGLTALETQMDQNRQRHEHHLNRLDGLAQKFEGELKHAPNHNDLQNIHKRLDTVAATVSEISGGVNGMQSTLTTIHEFLLNGGKR